MTASTLFTVLFVLVGGIVCVFIAQAIWIGVRGSPESVASAPEETDKQSKVQAQPKPILPARPIPPTTLAGKTCAISGAKILIFTQGRLCDQCHGIFHVDSLKDGKSTQCPHCNGLLLEQAEIDARCTRPEQPGPDESTLSGRMESGCGLIPIGLIGNFILASLILLAEGGFTFVMATVMSVAFTVMQLAAFLFFGSSKVNPKLPKL